MKAVRIRLDWMDRWGSVEARPSPGMMLLIGVIALAVLFSLIFIAALAGKHIGAFALSSLNNPIARG